jgi:ribonuclease-3
MARRTQTKSGESNDQGAIARPSRLPAESPAKLEAILGHTFKQTELLTLALTHRSYVYDAELSVQATAANQGLNLADPSLDNEQLEFLGDAVLGLLAAEALCQHFPASREGELTRLRASVVSRRYLGEVGTQLELGRWLRLGRTAEQNQGRSNAALFANAVEALIAALYLDGGLPAARRFVEERVLAGALPEMERAVTQGRGTRGDRFSGVVGDFKSALQEMLQADGARKPQYRLLSQSGPDHRRVFRVEVRLDGDENTALAEAEGSTKKQAQQEAARLAVAKLTAARQEAAHG